MDGMAAGGDVIIQTVEPFLPAAAEAEGGRAIPREGGGGGGMMYVIHRILGMCFIQGKEPNSG